MEESPGNAPERAPDAPTAEPARAGGAPRRGGFHLRAVLAFAVGLLAGLAASRPTVGASDDARGIATALGTTVGGVVEADDFVWEPPGGFLLDALWGRGVVFRALVTGRDAAHHDVFHARMRLGREGRALDVVEVRNLTRTPDADEGPLVGHAGAVAFTSHDAHQLTGVTAIELSRRHEGASALRRLSAAVASRLAPELGAPWPTWTLALRSVGSDGSLQAYEGGFELRTARGVVRLDLRTGALSGPASASADTVRTPAEPPTLTEALSLRVGRWLTRKQGHEGRPSAAEATPPPASSGTVEWPPALAGAHDQRWATEVPGLAEGAAPLLASIDVGLSGGGRARVVAIDTRALDLVPRAGWRRPHATTGPRGTGNPPPAPRTLVARIDAAPFGSGGFVDDGRVLVPPRDAETFLVAGSEVVALGRFAASQANALRPRFLVQSDEPTDDRGRIAVLCRTADRQLLVAWSEAGTPSELVNALGPSACGDRLFLEPRGEPLAIGDAATQGFPSAEPFFALERRVDALATRQDGARFEPLAGTRGDRLGSAAVRRARVERSDGAVEVVAIDVPRFDWRLVAGAADAQGHTCEATLSPAEDDAVALVIGLGASFPERPRGLALDGAIVQPFVDDRGVLLAATERTGTIARAPLELALTVDGMATSRDAAELVLLAEAGVVRREARELGATKLRGALCLASRDLLLHASGRFDSGEPLAEELLKLGCRRVLSADRGRLASGIVERRGVEGGATVGAGEVALVGLVAPSRGKVVGSASTGAP